MTTLPDDPPGCYNSSPLVEAVTAIADKRVAFLLLGDSNLLYFGTGHDQGLVLALANAGALFATPLFSANENGGSGAGQGYLCNYNSKGSPWGSVTGAPAALAAYLDPGAGSLSPANYAYITSDVGTWPNNGIQLAATWPGDVSANLQGHLWWGSFDSGSGTHRICFRLGQNPYTTYTASSVTITTNTGELSVHHTISNLAADAGRTTPTELRLTRDGYTLTAPAMWYYHLVENADRAAGYAVSSWLAHGGASARTLAYDLQQASDATIAQYLGIWFDLVGSDGLLCIAISTGLNDRTDTALSLGPQPADSSTPQGFIDNLRAIQERILTVAQAAALDTTRIRWLIAPSHPLSTPDDARLLSYRNAARVLGRAMTTVIDTGAVLDQPTMESEGYYAAPEDHEHLSAAGYYYFWNQIRLAIREPI